MDQTGYERISEVVSPYVVSPSLAGGETAGFLAVRAATNEATGGQNPFKPEAVLNKLDKGGLLSNGHHRAIANGPLLEAILVAPDIIVLRDLSYPY